MTASTSQPLFYVVDWLPPDFGAVGQYAVISASEIAKAGRRVELVGLTTGKGGVTEQRYPAGGSIKITRIPVLAYDKTSNLKRLLWALQTNSRLITKVIQNPLSRQAELLFTGSPPFMVIFAFAAKLLRSMKLTYRITDFFPEAVIAHTEGRSWPLFILQKFIWMLRRKVDGFEVLGEDQRQLLLNGGIAPERIALKRDGSPIFVSGNERPAQRPSGLGPGPILLYSGNYGIAHDADTVVDGLVEHYRRQPANPVALWLNATGVKADLVESRLRLESIGVAHTKPVSLDELPFILAAADVHLITLRPQFVGIVLPSKVYSCISSRRPILFVGPQTSDVHLLCSQAADIRYEQVTPGDAIGFADALDRLTATTETLGCAKS